MHPNNLDCYVVREQKILHIGDGQATAGRGFIANGQSKAKNFFYLLLQG